MHPNMNFGTTLVVFAFPSIMRLEDHIKNVLQKKNFGTKVLGSRSKIGNIGHHFLQISRFWNIFVSQLSSVFAFPFTIIIFAFV